MVGRVISRRRESPPDTDPIRYVISLNLHRRHLSESQRAMIAAEIANMRKGDNKEKRIGTNAHSDSPPISIAEAASLMNVGERTVREAKKVIRDAAPEIVEMVKTGKVTVKSGMLASDLPKDEQEKAAKDGRADRRPLQKRGGQGGREFLGRGRRLPRVEPARLDGATDSRRVRHR